MKIPSIYAQDNGGDNGGGNGEDNDDFGDNGEDFSDESDDNGDSDGIDEVLREEDTEDEDACASTYFGGSGAHTTATTAAETTGNGDVTGGEDAGASTYFGGSDADTTAAGIDDSNVLAFNAPTEDDTAIQPLTEEERKKHLTPLTDRRQDDERNDNGRDDNNGKRYYKEVKKIINKNKIIVRGFYNIEKELLVISDRNTCPTQTDNVTLSGKISPKGIRLLVDFEPCRVKDGSVTLNIPDTQNIKLAVLFIDRTGNFRIVIPIKHCLQLN